MNLNLPPCHHKITLSFSVKPTAKENRAVNLLMAIVSEKGFDFRKDAQVHMYSGMHSEVQKLYAELSIYNKRKTRWRIEDLSSENRVCLLAMFRDASEFNDHLDSFRAKILQASFR